MIRTSHVARGALAAVSLLALAACTDPVAVENGKDISELNQLHVTYDYPTLAATTVSFWAVKGRATSAELWYHARAGATDSAKFVDFRVGANAIDRRPDGTAFAPGDSVRITLTATDPRHMMISFEPSGLKFSATDKPTLKMFWVACGDDLNYDGKVDASDEAIMGKLGIWRQETPGARWFYVGSAVVGPTREVNAQLAGFTGYALMY
jgi:hypothetical protein